MPVPLPSPSPDLADGRVALRLAAERDIPEVLIAHEDDPGLARALGESRPPSGAQLGRRVEQIDARRVAGEELWLTITDAGADELRGQLEVVDIDPDHGRAGVRLWVAPRQRGRGLGTAGLALVGHWLLSDAGLARVQLCASPDDGAVWTAAQRAGFHVEGVLRGHRLDADGRADVRIASLVAADL